MNHSSLFELMEQWTQEQLLADINFCRMRSDSIWLHDNQRSIEYLNEKDTSSRISWPDEPVQINLQLPIDDEPNDWKSAN